jgi:hypothetical protein
MLGDLRRKLSTVGRLELMRAVDDKAIGYFATLDPRDLTDRALEEQARARRHRRGALQRRQSRRGAGGLPRGARAQPTAPITTRRLASNAGAQGCVRGEQAGTVMAMPAWCPDRRSEPAASTGDSPSVTLR